jgi:ankyrin repeat protein
LCPAQYGHTPEEIVEFASLFLDHGAEINALENKLQSTPLGWAARFGNIVLVKYFLERGADPHLAGENWATPLAWAEREGYVDIVEILDNM